MSFHNSKRTMTNYPATYEAIANVRQAIERPVVFEPALLHFSSALRFGDPSIQDPEIRIRWITTRRQVMDHLLRMVNGSRWKEHLVLRGSLLLKAWLGENAREPGDIDWVFRHSNISLTDPLASYLFDELIRTVSKRFQVGDAMIEVDKIAVDDIWTYERASGRRVIFPWIAEGLPPGVVQIDVVFGEELWKEPIQTLIPCADGSNIPVWAADPEVSLAWKLRWLETDRYPQGKDLYDATLLAEQTRLSHTLLLQVLRSGDWQSTSGLMPEFPLAWYVDWNNFKEEYPWVKGEAKEWQSRLARALAPTFMAEG